MLQRVPPTVSDGNLTQAAESAARPAAVAHVVNDAADIERGSAAFLMVADTEVERIHTANWLDRSEFAGMRRRFLAVGEIARRREILRGTPPRGEQTRRAWRWARTFAAALTLSLMLGTGPTAVTTAVATAVPANPGQLEELTVPSSMGPVRVQVQWAAHGGHHAVYMLDGLQASWEQNGWAIAGANTLFADDDLTLIMPVGGPASWYADWAAPSRSTGQVVTYRWETFLTRELPDYLAEYGISRSGNAIVGLSMGASAALTLAAGHRDMFSHATALSGALDWHTPEMAQVLALATWHGGYDLAALTTFGSPQWWHMDPWTVAPELRGMPMYISAAPGIPGIDEQDLSPRERATTFGAMAIEAAACESTRRFRQRLTDLGIEAVFHFPETGTHQWRYWVAELAHARPYILAALDAHR